MRSARFPVRWFVSTAAILVVAALMYFLSHNTPEGKSGTLDSSPLAVERQIVCLGYIDVAEGVTALTTPQPSRVIAVFVKENQHVEAKTLLLSGDDRALREAVREAEAKLLAANDRLDDARRMTKRHEIQLEQQKARIRAARARLETARREAELKQSAKAVEQASLRLTRARLETAKRNLELKQNLKSLQQANAKEVAVAAEQVKEREAGVELEVASMVGEKEVAIAEQRIRECEAAIETESMALAELQLIDPQQQVRQTTADVQRARAGLKQAQLAVDEQHLRAPTAGTALRVLTRPGEIISAASTAVLFAADGPRIVRAEVEQAEVGRLVIGADVTIKDDAVSSRAWHGKVLRLADWYSKHRNILQETPTFTDVPTVECLISIDKNGLPPRIGQRVRVHIEPAAKQGTAKH
jgi:HlyD family secretion protein